jgi:hypothetical protein
MGAATSRTPRHGNSLWPDPSSVCVVLAWPASGSRVCTCSAVSRFFWYIVCLDLYSYSYLALATDCCVYYSKYGHVRLPLAVKPSCIVPCADLLPERRHGGRRASCASPAPAAPSTGETGARGAQRSPLACARLAGASATRAFASAAKTIAFVTVMSSMLLCCSHIAGAIHTSPLAL